MRGHSPVCEKSQEFEVESTTLYRPVNSRDSMNGRHSLIKQLGMSIVGCFAPFESKALLKKNIQLSDSMLDCDT